MPPLALCCLLAGACAAGPPTRALSVPVQTEAHAEPLAEALRFDELLAPGSELAPSEKAKRLAERRVRLVGFMAQLELELPGRFYLTPRPLRSDEAAGGTADLPPDSVLVTVSDGDQAVPFLSGPLEVIGTLEVGNQTDQRGHVSAFRIRSDQER